MICFLESPTVHLFSQILLGSVWVFHGLYSKILNGIPRHRLIVGKILGASHAVCLTNGIGFLEILLGLWAWSGWQPFGCALVQTAAIISMNTLEIIFARELLISALGMVLLNSVFLALVWHWALMPA
jgi:hypothetical protein